MLIIFSPCKILVLSTKAVRPQSNHPKDMCTGKIVDTLDKGRRKTKRPQRLFMDRVKDTQRVGLKEEEKDKDLCQMNSFLNLPF